MALTDPATSNSRRLLVRVLGISAVGALLIAVACHFSVARRGRVPTDAGNREVSSSGNSNAADDSAPNDVKPRGELATGPVSGIEPPPLNWEHLVRQDRPRQSQPSLENAVLAITSHNEPKSAQFPLREEVSRIEVTRAQHVSLPGAPEPPPL